MTTNDWIALCILLGFLALGSPRPWRRRGRVSILIAAFIALHLYPWLTQTPSMRAVMPFRSYSLYAGRAPAAYTYAEIVLVAGDGTEHAVDFRVWQPFIPRSFNELLQRRFISGRLSEVELEAVGRVLLARVADALARLHRDGEFAGYDAYLLGRFHYPQHQTAAVAWTSEARLPLPQEVRAVRVYLVTYDAAQRRQFRMSHRRMLHEFHQ